MAQNITLSGAEFKAFYSDLDFWPDGVWHDDTIIEIDGADADEALDEPERIPDAAEVVIRGGDVRQEDPSAVFGRDLGTLSQYIQKWRKQKGGAEDVILRVEVTPENRTAIERAIHEAGGRVLS